MLSERPERRYKSNGLAQSPPPYAFAQASLLADEPADPKEQKPLDPELDEEWQALYDHLEGRLQALYNWRVATWTTWAQIACYERPNRFYAFVETSNLYNLGLRQDYAIVDRTATLCGEICAAGLMSTLTDPDREWQKYGPAIPGLELDRAGKHWYEDLTERDNYILDHSNFYEAQAQAYDDLTFFGNGVTVDHEDEQNILQVRTPCAGEYMIGVNFDNAPGVLYEDTRMTISQMVEMFGLENCPADARRMWREKGGALEYQQVIAHAIEPNFAVMGSDDGSGVGVVPGGFAWREVYWVKGQKNQRPLSMCGFHEQPWDAMAWNKQGSEAYGRGVGENMLGDAVQLQMQTRDLAVAIEKVLDPPMVGDSTLMNQPSSTSPGKITWINMMSGKPQFYPAYQITPDIKAISDNMQQVRDRIARTAYNDVFQPLLNLRQQLDLKTDITATEVERLTQEVLNRLGPMMMRVYGTLRNRAKRRLGIMARRGLIPPKPPSLHGIPMKVEFVSLLTEARRAVHTQSIARTMQFAGAQAEIWPILRHKINALKGVQDFGEGVGAPANLFNTDQEAAKAMQAETQSQQQQAMLKNSLPLAKGAQALSNTSLAPGSALSALAQPPGLA